MHSPERLASGGMTLIELMISIGLIAIVASIATPSFHTLLLDHRAQQQQLEWRGFLGAARVASVTDNQWVTVCPIDNNRCVTDTGKTWAAFHDNNRNAILDAPDERIIRHLEPGENASLVMYKGITKLPYFRYRPTGASGNLRSLTVCPDGTLNERTFHLTSTHLGRVRFSRDTDKDGIVDRRYQGKQQNVTCP